jgi:hypothetical protein
MSSGNLEPQKPENLLTAYRELCTSYRAIDDFRTKLLGFLPLATGTGIFFLVNDKAKIDSVQPYFRSMGAFGFVITLGRSEQTGTQSRRARARDGRNQTRRARWRLFNRARIVSG